MRPKPFILCFEDHRPDGLIWAVQQSRRWRISMGVVVNVPTQTVYRGKKAEQPRAYLRGVGVVRGTQGLLVIDSQ